MGNRATIIFTRGDTMGAAVYLHWHGGPESVYAFLVELDRREIRDEVACETARFVSVVSDFFDGDYTDSLSLYVMNWDASMENLLAGNIPTELNDNGVYLVTRHYNDRSWHRHGPRATVRRFTESDKGFEEWVPKAVKHERLKALKHGKYSMILEELTKARPIVGYDSWKKLEKAKEKEKE